MKKHIFTLWRKGDRINTYVDRGISAHFEVETPSNKYELAFYLKACQDANLWLAQVVKDHQKGNYHG